MTTTNANNGNTIKSTSLQLIVAALQFHTLSIATYGKLQKTNKGYADRRYKAPLRIWNALYCAADTLQNAIIGNYEPDTYTAWLRFSRKAKANLLSLASGNNA